MRTGGSVDRATLPEPAANGAGASGVSVSRVTAGYGERRVLSLLDFEAPPRSLTALSGPNGVGKTTLLRLIAGVFRPSEGTVRVMGTDVSSISARERARLTAVVPQNPELPRGATALEVVLMGRNPHLSLLQWESEDDVTVAVEALRMTDTEHLMERPVDELSGGERQRVAIAMALAQRTPVILLDEPTANLDLVYQPSIMRLLRDLAASGKTVVTALHDLTLAGQFCDGVALLSEGRVAAAGPPETTLTSAAIKSVYGADALVIKHPDTGRPIVVGR